MNEAQMMDLLARVRSGAVSAQDAAAALRMAPIEELGGFAVVDHHRALRQGVPEVVYGAGKTPDQAAAIASALAAKGGSNILVTRCSPEMAQAIAQREPDSEYRDVARICIVRPQPAQHMPAGTILVCAAGTSDLPVAEEAAVTAEALGNRVGRIYDVGVAGLHRLLRRLPDIMAANVIVAVAGMEGALPSVIGGLTDRPVIAVPTSVGYGASFGGLAALLAMLNSCASGISVVNIDNGFGAGYQAALINRPGRAGNGQGDGPKAAPLG